jgi:hypothetical protein
MRISKNDKISTDQSQFSCQIVNNHIKMKPILISLVVFIAISPALSQKFFSRHLSCAEGTIECINVDAMTAGVKVNKIKTEDNFVFFDLELSFQCTPNDQLHYTAYDEPCRATTNKFNDVTLKAVTKDAVEVMANVAGVQEDQCNLDGMRGKGSSAYGTRTDTYKCGE